MCRSAHHVSLRSPGGQRSPSARRDHDHENKLGISSSIELGVKGYIHICRQHQNASASTGAPADSYPSQLLHPSAHICMVPAFSSMFKTPVAMMHAHFKRMLRNVSALVVSTAYLPTCSRSFRLAKSGRGSEFTGKVRNVVILAASPQSQLLIESTLIRTSIACADRQTFVVTPPVDRLHTLLEPW